MALATATEGPACRSDAVEVDAAEWWRLFTAAVADLPAGDLRHVDAIAICGLTRTHIVLGADDHPLRPAITWRDLRAAGVAADLAADLPAAWPERTRLDASHPAARLAWLARHEPAIHARIQAVIEPKDYLNLRLTGRVASDPISAARLAAAAAKGASILDHIGTGSVLPPLLPPTAIVGRVREGLPGALSLLAGRPVLAGSNDTWAAVVGLGALQPGMAYNISGTTEVLGLVGASAATAEGLLTVEWGDGLYQLGGPGQNGADTIGWLLALLGRMQAGTEVGPALDLLLAEACDAQPLLFLPFLQGERTPFWDSALRGAFIGLGRRHGAGDIARAVLEGTGFLNRLVLERAEAAFGAPAREIRAGGGAARNAAWCQIKADICRRPLVSAATAEPGLVGCALLVAVALGREPNLAAAQRRMPIGPRYDPDPTAAAFYDQLYPAFTTAAAALRPISHALASEVRPSCCRAC